MQGCNAWKLPCWMENDEPLLGLWIGGLFFPSASGNRRRRFPNSAGISPLILLRSSLVNSSLSSRVVLPGRLGRRRRRRLFVFSASSPASPPPERALAKPCARKDGGGGASIPFVPGGWGRRSSATVVPRSAMAGRI
uniref:Uncharacterized protein n=1 Tax=Oryza glumipatula TaxID=40148 RepID=A0A0E0B7B2_9ORYZ